MIFASTVSDGIMSGLVLLALGLMAVQKLLGKLDKGGAIGGVANDSIVRVIVKLIG